MKQLLIILFLFGVMSCKKEESPKQYGDNEIRAQVITGADTVYFRVNSSLIITSVPANGFEYLFKAKQRGDRINISCAVPTVGNTPISIVYSVKDKVVKREEGLCSSTLPFASEYIVE